MSNIGKIFATGLSANISSSKFKYETRSMIQTRSHFNFDHVLRMVQRIIIFAQYTFFLIKITIKLG